MLQVHHAHLLLSLLPLHVLPPPPLLRPPRCCRRERTARAPSLVRSGCADAYMIACAEAEESEDAGGCDAELAASPTAKLPQLPLAKRTGGKSSVSMDLPRHARVVEGRLGWPRRPRLRTPPGRQGLSGARSPRRRRSREDGEAESVGGAQRWTSDPRWGRSWRNVPMSQGSSDRGGFLI
ncbi:unnamed protein product [Prorocentrum cordatum]|uniref:Uncharacterized protein n=1 Tax=Prorocentrum cordatum TaxID=2364126 RepID=A0ABN9SAF2_9DINO|nr:unnamed protein product [Polarella glacialis]